jgi:hypothetical protein
MNTDEYKWSPRSSSVDKYAKLKHEEMIFTYRHTTKKIKKLRKKIEFAEILINEIKTNLKLGGKI